MTGLLARWNALDEEEKARRLNEASDRMGIGQDDLEATAVEPSEACEASAGQRAQYFLDQQVGEGPSPYRIPLALELRGDYDRSALVEAARQAVQALPVLRSALRADADGAVESVLLADSDVGALVQSVEVAASEAGQYMTQLACATQRTTDPGLFKATLLLVEGGTDTLMLCGHHAVVDGLSMAMVVDLIAEQYRLLRSHETAPPLAPLASYRGLIPATTGRHQAAVESAVPWWREHLSGATPARFAPDTSHTSNVSRTAAGHYQTRIPAAAWSGLRQCAQARGAGDAAAVLALVSTVVARHMGEEDFVVGLSTAGRAVASEMDCVGPFADTVPVRVNVAAEAPVRDVIETLADSPATGAAHELPFSRLVAELAPERRTGRNPLYDVLVTMDPLATEEQQVDEQLSWTMRNVLNHTARVPFQVTASPEADGGLALRIDYALREYTRSYAEQLATEIVDAAKDIETTPEAEALVATPGLASDTLSGVRLVVEQFHTQAQAHPEQVAIRQDGSEFTYAEVDRLSDLLAADLVTRTRAGERVADMTGVCAAAPLTILALFKAGLVYVPTSAEQPRERLSAMLDDAAVRLVLRARLTGQGFHVGYETTSGEAVDSINVEDVDPETGGAGRSHPVAYVIFTSGSTGRPKGVEVSHDALGLFAASMKTAGHIRECETVLAITSTTFDISLDELLLPLTVGGSTEVGPPAIAKGAAGACSIISEGRVDVVHATPSVLQLLIAAGWDTSVRRILVGGEPLSRQMALQLIERGRQVVNLYGPTEATVWAFAASVTRESLYDDRGPTIGRPLPGYRAVVLDQHLHPLPAGVPGELCLGGRALAEGYLGNSDLTARQFPDTKYGRLYRTGDVARMRRDGVVEYVGRRDSQIKLRGHRIELGEIEAVARDVGAVVDCAAAVVGESLGLLVVGVVGEELRAQLAGRLTSAMVPTHIHAVDALPMTPNGKLDRRSVELLLSEQAACGDAPAGQTHQGDDLHAAPASAEAADSTADGRPDTTHEAWVAHLWGELLGRRVSRWDNLFEVGGHSLLLARTMARAREDLHLDISLEEMFVDPTPHGIGALLAHADRNLQSVLAMVAGLDDQQAQELLERS